MQQTSSCRKINKNVLPLIAKKNPGSGPIKKNVYGSATLVPRYSLYMNKRNVHTYNPANHWFVCKRNGWSSPSLSADWMIFSWLTSFPSPQGPGHGMSHKGKTFGKGGVGVGMVLKTRLRIRIRIQSAMSNIFVSFTIFGWLFKQFQVENKHKKISEEIWVIWRKMYSFIYIGRIRIRFLKSDLLNSDPVEN